MSRRRKQKTKEKDRMEQLEKKKRDGKFFVQKKEKKKEKGEKRRGEGEKRRREGEKRRGEERKERGEEEKRRKKKNKKKTEIAVQEMHRPLRAHSLAES